VATSTYSVFSVTNDEPWLPAGVRDRAEDLLGLEVAEVDPRDAVVGVVVHEEPAAVVEAVGLREAGVVDIAPGEVAEHGLRLLVEAVAGPGYGAKTGMVEMCRIEGRPATNTWPEWPPE
jgi:hypothetical protein